MVKSAWFFEGSCGTRLSQAVDEKLSNHPPAKPGALEFVSRSKRLTGVANAARQFLGHLKVAGQLHSFIWSRR